MNELTIFLIMLLVIVVGFGSVYIVGFGSVYIFDTNESGKEEVVIVSANETSDLEWTLLNSTTYTINGYSQEEIIEIEESCTKYEYVSWRYGYPTCMLKSDSEIQIIQNEKLIELKEMEICIELNRHESINRIKEICQ